MAEVYKRLYRSRNNRMLFGVCGGLGEYLNVDPTVIRLIFVLAFLPGGPGLLAYLVLALLVPEEPLEEIQSESAESGVENAGA
jgi:phage shock protein PspC (stress-responsive transcriptional regulator)